MPDFSFENPPLLTADELLTSAKTEEHDREISLTAYRLDARCQECGTVMIVITPYPKGQLSDAECPCCGKPHLLWWNFGPKESNMTDVPAVPDVPNVLGMHIGAQNPDHLITVGGRTWAEVESLTIESGVGRPALVTLQVLLDKPLRILGRWSVGGMPGLDDGMGVDLEINISSMYSRVIIDHHDIRHTRIFVAASGESTTFIEITALLGGLEDTKETLLSGMLVRDYLNGNQT